ncbi:MAG TPA: helix-turn-helix transcriptional regulator [Candidatus Onthoplasma faecigallinarum]|nr:helix-turn-helix transcriptional regulator [Candidatus Onthoplasma faecigallinarum]
MTNLQEAMNIFSSKLIDLMQDKKLNIKELSAKTNIPRSTINSWTLKKRSPKIDYLCTLADFFGVTIDYLVGREN